MRLLRTILLLTCFPFGLPAFGAGREITTPTYGPSGGVSWPVTASNGETFLTVWTEAFGIQGSLADRDGKVITPVSFPILPLDYFISGGLDVTSAGAGYVIAFARGTGLQLAELSAAGTLLKRSTVDVAFLRARIAWNGSSFLIVGTVGSGSAQPQAVACLVDRDGAILRSEPLGKSQFVSNVVVQGDEFVVATAVGSSMMVHWIGGDGAVARSRTAGPISASPADPALAVRGDDVLVLWNGPPAVQAALLTGRGDVASVRNVSTGSLILRSQLFVAPTAAGYTAALFLCSGPYSNDCGTFLSRFDPSGRPVDDVPFRVSAAPVRSLAVSGSTLLMVTVSSTVETHAIDPVTRTMNSSIVSISAAQQHEPALASNGLDFLAAFAETTADGSIVKEARFTREGSALDGPGLTLSAATGRRFPAIAYGASRYLVVWTDATALTLFARRFDEMGNAIDAEPLTVGPADANVPPSVAWNGHHFLAAWPYKSGIVSARIPPEGNPDSMVSVALPTLGQLFTNPDVASDGSEFLVAWGAGSFLCDPCSGAPGSILLTGVDSRGVPFVGKPLVAASASGGHVASNGAGFLLAVDTIPAFADGPWAAGVATAAVHVEDGAVTIGPLRKQFGWPSGTHSDVVWDGRGYVIAWRYATIATSFLGAAHVSSSNFVFDRRAITASGPPSRFSYGTRADPAAAANALGDVAIVTSESSRLRAYFLREMDDPPPLPGTPSNVRASFSGFSLTVTWDKPAGEVAEYTIDTLSLGTVHYGRELAAPANTSTFVPYHSPGPLWVRVQAWNAAGPSDPSPWTQVPAMRSRSVRR